VSNVKYRKELCLISYYREKKARQEYFETSYSENQDCSPSHVEYIIESEQDNTDCRVEEEEDEEPSLYFQTTSVEEEQIQETATAENNRNSVKPDDRIAQSVCLYDSNENESTPHEEISYQEAFVNEASLPVTSELDSWLSSLKQTLLMLTNISVISQGDAGSCKEKHQRCRQRT
jgi:hypothetical protein